MTAREAVEILRAWAGMAADPMGTHEALVMGAAALERPEGT